MTPEVIATIMKFMNRVQLSGAEVQSWMACMEALNREGLIAQGAGSRDEEPKKATS